MRKLRDELPYEFMGCEFDDCRARKFSEVGVIKEYDAREEKWIGKHKNITYWFELVNGYAVGLNENPARGMSFPVEKLERMIKNG